jgi:hypothetical protein
MIFSLYFCTLMVQMDKAGELRGSPQYFIAALSTNLSLAMVKLLRIEMKSKDQMWMEAFRKEGGLAALVDAVHSIQRQRVKEKNDLETQLELIRCVSTVINTKGAMDELVQTDLINRLTLLIDSPEPQLKKSILELLVAITALHPAGHKKVVEAFDYFKYITKEPRRFTRLVDILKYETVPDVKMSASLSFFLSFFFLSLLFLLVSFSSFLTSLSLSLNTEHV